LTGSGDLRDAAQMRYETVHAGRYDHGLTFGERGIWPRYRLQHPRGVHMKSSDAGSVVQYGVETPSSTSVLLVTDRLDEAEHILEVVGQGRIVQRTVRYGAWHPVEDSDSAQHTFLGSSDARAV
jgi:hypothetical protein